MAENLSIRELAERLERSDFGCFGERESCKRSDSVVSLFPKARIILGISKYTWKYNLVRLQEFNEEGCEAKLRLNEDGKPYVTDNSNYIVDLYFKTPNKDGPAAGKGISSPEGVVEHGLLLDMATAVNIAGNTSLDVKTK